jgi:hypothetical protein
VEDDEDVCTFAAKDIDRPPPTPKSNPWPPTDPEHPWYGALSASDVDDPEKWKRPR